MTKCKVKHIKKLVLISHVVIILVCALVMWFSLYYLFSHTNIIKDVVKVINDGTASAVGLTWGVFWIVLPILVLIQFGGSLIPLSVFEEKEKEKKEVKKTKRKKK